MDTHDFSSCPRCHSPLEPSRAYSGASSEFWKSCSNPKCNTFVNTYIPLPHQFAFHQDPHILKGNFGGLANAMPT